MCFQDDDRGADGICQVQELVCCGDIGAEAEVGLLDCHETEEVGGQGVGSCLGSFREGSLGEIVRTGWRHCDGVLVSS